MRAPGDILLVSTYELGRPPLGIAWPAAFLERAGFRPATLDLSVEPLDESRIANARFVGISVPMHTALRLGVRLAERVRALAPTAHVCFHGLYAFANASFLLERLGDSVVSGEHEAALVAWIEALEADAAEPGAARSITTGAVAGGGTAIPGIRVRGGEAAPILRRLDFPAPSRAGLPPLDRYARIDVDGRQGLAAAVEASRGCLHRCRHCPIPPVYDGRFFVVPEAVVLADVDAAVAAGATHVTFADPDFLNAPAHARRVLERLHARHPSLTVDVTAKVEHLLRDPAFLGDARRWGCLFVVTALESLSDRVLAILEKGHTRADALELLDLAREAGVCVRPSLLPFTPWSTLDDYLELLDLLVDRDLVDHVDPVQLTIRLLVPAGSLLERDPEFVPHRGPFEAERLSWRWTHPDPRMDALHERAARIAADAARAGEPPETTFARLREAALEARDGAHRRAVAGEARDATARRPRAPRLTEPWFC